MLDDSLTKIFTLVSYADLMINKLNIEKSKHEVELYRVRQVIEEIHQLHQFASIDPGLFFRFNNTQHTYSDLIQYEKV